MLPWRHAGCRGLGARELAVLGFALLLPLAFVVQAFIVLHDAEVRVCSSRSGPGLVVLALACRAGDRAAWWAAAFLGAARSPPSSPPTPALSLFGGYGW